MAYCSATAIYTALPALPDLETDNGYSECASIIDLHIRRADGLINGKCARRYALPFTTVPPFIRTLAEDIVCYYVYRTMFTGDAQNKSEYLSELKDDALADLNAIMQGDIDLVDTNGSAIPVLTDELEDKVNSNTIDAQPFFDIDEPLDWEFDKDLKDTINDYRN